MARKLATKTNAIPPDGTYIYGRLKDETAPGAGDGVPISENVYGDIHQFFERLIAQSGLTANGQPDNDYVGFQLYEALLLVISKQVGNRGVGLDLDDTSTNFNDYKYGGTFTVNGTSFTNGPTGFTGNGQLCVSGAPNSAITQRIVDSTNGAEWVRTYTYPSTYSAWTLIKLARKVINIGDWNMDSTGSVTVASGITMTKVRRMSAIIRMDDDSQYHNLTDSLNGSIYKLSGNNITLARTATGDPSGFGGGFDNGNYDSTSFNRGWINLEYDPT